MHRLRPLALVGALIATACNAGDVMSIASAHGIDLTSAEAQSVADHYNACDADVACTIRAIFPDQAEAKALHVARCESGLNPLAKNRTSTASGLFQIIRATWRAYADAGMDIFNPHDNTVVAHRIWQDSGWAPWECA